jgi:hypothetical protein
MFTLTGVLVDGGRLIVTGSDAGIISGAMSTDFRVNGGTVVASGSVMDISSFDYFVITGGSVNARKISGWNPEDGSGNRVYLVTVTVGDPPVENTQVTCSVNGGAPFTCITDGEGKLYLWMPEGQGGTEIDIGGTIYRANGTVETNYDNVMLAQPDPIVTGVDVSPASVTAVRGSTVQFSALVEGQYNPPQNVTWTVENAHQGTTMDASGLLTISAYESSRTLRVTATSTYDTSKSDTAQVTINLFLRVVIVVALLLLFLALFVILLVVVPYLRRE